VPDTAQTRVVLLVEDNPADADLVCDMMADASGERERYRYRVIPVTRLIDAVARLQHEPIDVVLLDLGLPDSSGLDALGTIRAASVGTPIIVLTGTDDDLLAARCLNLGAQDYLSKNEIRPISLRRSINYAIARSLESEIQELRDALDRYRDLSTAAPSAASSAPRDQGGLKARQPAVYTTLVDAYADLLHQSFHRLVARTDKPRHMMERIADQLGDYGSTPRDLIDVHIAALHRTVNTASGVKARALAIEGRLVALEMMGLLVEYYRTGKPVEHGR
jgi:DNA-binding response OmpR family regulator